MKVWFQLQGNRPMLQHNGQLSDPFHPISVAMKKITDKSNITEADLSRLIYLESKGAAYITDDGYIGLPNEVVWSTVYKSAKNWKKGEDIKKGLRCENLIVPLMVGGQQAEAESFLTTESNIDRRSVKIGRNRVMRARPIIHNWASTHVFELDEDVVNPDDLYHYLAHAGKYIGVGDYRPRYGTFEASMEVEADAVAA